MSKPNSARLPLLLLIAALLLPASIAAAQIPTYRNPKAPLEARVQDLFQRLTPAEKRTLLTGTDFTTTPVPRLGIPPMEMVDAGQGVRGGSKGTMGPATLFPSGITMASTWNPALLHRTGQALGEEVLNKGTGAQVLLGPDVNIHRSPLGGRNGEAFSEDPFLSGQLAVGYIQGLQSTGCAACVKHYIANNEEVDRGFVNVIVGERALREIYMPSFKAAVQQGHVWTLMASYNKINGYYATANEYLLTGVLKQDWGYDGLVMSDWGAVHETVGVVNAGNDLEMPGPGQLSAAKLERAERDGLITQAGIDEAVRRTLRTMIRVGLMDAGKGPHVPDHRLVDAPAHRQAALEVAQEGIVLLKNADNLLPLPAGVGSVAVIGSRAQGLQMGASGSPGLTPVSSVSPLEGLTLLMGEAVLFRYAPGVDLGSVGEPIPESALTLHGEYFANPKLEGAPALTRDDRQIQFAWDDASPGAGLPRTNFSVRWTGTLTAPVTGTYTLAMMADDGCRVFLDGKLLIDHWIDSPGYAVTAQADLTAGESHTLRVEYYQAGGKAFARLNWRLPGVVQTEFPEAIEAASKSNVAIIFAGSSDEGEGTDRPSLALPGNQDALIEAVAAVNKHTIVVLNNGTPVLMPWLDRVSGVLESWFPGEEGGTALAQVLFGRVNPSGKLPDTLGVRREDYPDFGHFPGVDGQVEYAEGIYVGYRHFDKQQIQPLFPFGYGLSYTTFHLDSLKLSSPSLSPTGTVTATVRVANTGSRAGAEVVQMYVHDPDPKIDKPVRELKGFAKVFLRPGESQTVKLALTPDALAYCDVAGKQWKADAGVYQIQIGTSSRDLPLQASVRLTRDYTNPIPNMGARPRPRVWSLALDKPATTSSVQRDTEDFSAKQAVDGDPSTRWSSAAADPQWLQVDLGKETRFRRVRLFWETAFAKAYQIQSSHDGQTWTDIATVTNGQGGVEQAVFPPVTARYVRIYCTQRATTFGDSIYSLEVYP